jgi:hypothetical protein
MTAIAVLLLCALWCTHGYCMAVIREAPIRYERPSPLDHWFTMLVNFESYLNDTGAREGAPDKNGR